MRMPRRGVIAQRKSDGYVWAIYSLKSGVDESVFTTGSFTMTATFSSTPSLMAADGYTVDSSGKITLTSAVKTNVSALTAGKYIVSISSSSSTTTTSTQYVYKVTGVTSSGSTFSKTYTVSYERYESSTNAKGDDTGERVQSNTMDYPVDGLHTDGKWYVMLKGSYMVYVWDVFNVVDSGWKTVESEPDRNTNPPIGIDGDTSLSYYDESSTIYYTTSKNNITINNSGYASGFSSSLSLKGVSSGWYKPLNTAYYAPKSSNNKHYYYGTDGSVISDPNGDAIGGVDAEKRYDIVKNYTKGSATGNTVESPNASAYPQNGDSGNYWYVYSHEYEKIIDNT